MNLQESSNVTLSENIILADADYIDRVALLLSAQFERMLGRRIPPADLSQWAVDVALDGGLRGDGKAHETQIILVHDHLNERMENFRPANYASELQAKAFRDEKLGEFLVNAYSVGTVVSKDDYILNAITTIVTHPETKRLMVIPDGEGGDLYARIRRQLRDVDNDQRITLFAMQSMEGGNFRQEQLGYSLMHALGIHADELG